jgi:hypothetical protein
VGTARTLCSCCRSISTRRRKSEFKQLVELRGKEFIAVRTGRELFLNPRPDAPER